MFQEVFWCYIIAFNSIQWYSNLIQRLHLSGKVLTPVNVHQCTLDFRRWFRWTWQPKIPLFWLIKHLCSFNSLKVILRACYVLVLHVQNMHRWTLGFTKIFWLESAPNYLSFDTSNFSVAQLVQKLCCVHACTWTCFGSQSVHKLRAQTFYSVSLIPIGVVTSIWTPQTFLQLQWFTSNVACSLRACAHCKRAPMHARLQEVV